MIAYASVYGGTENAAELLSVRLRERGVKTVMFDVSVTPASDIIAAAFRWSRAEVCRDLAEARRKLMEATGRAPTLLRPPGGLYDTAVLQQTACADLPVILWSVDPEDWRVHDADAVTAHILRHAEPGSVILMHDLTDSSVTAALRVIDALQAQGYEFLTVSELAARSGTALRPGQAYCSFPP